jgi:ADP-ribose pyrophosphatase
VPEFRQVSEVEVFKGWMYSVGEAHFEDPSGGEFQRFVIRHPGAVVVVPVHDDGQVTLVRQYRGAVDQMVLEAPAGTCDVSGEPPEETAHRELIEEAGLQAASMEFLMGTYNTPGVSDQLSRIFLATGLTPVPKNPAGVEEHYMTVETIALDSFEDLVADGTLVDETTVLGLYLARAHLAK